MSFVCYSETMSGRYDADFSAVYGSADRGDVAFFQWVVARADGPVCEIGAGTARMLIAVSSVTEQRLCGVEPSPAMRARGQQNLVAQGLADRISLADGRFSDTGLDTASCALIFSAFRSFQHVLTPEAQLASLREIRRVLRPGGVLAMDLFDPDYDLLVDSAPTVVMRYLTPHGNTVERLDGRRVHRAQQRVDASFRWVERDPLGQTVSDHTDVYTIRYTFPYELQHLLTLAGFSDIVLFGGYDRRQLSDEPGELVVMARSL